MDQGWDNVIDGTERAEQWRRRRKTTGLRAAARSDAPKSIAISLLVPDDWPAEGAPARSADPGAEPGQPGSGDVLRPSDPTGVESEAENPFLAPGAEAVGLVTHRSRRRDRLRARAIDAVAAIRSWLARPGSIPPTRRLAEGAAGSVAEAARRRGRLGVALSVSVAAALALLVVAPWSAPRSPTAAAGHRRQFTAAGRAHVTMPRPVTTRKGKHRRTTESGRTRARPRAGRRARPKPVGRLAPARHASDRQDRTSSSSPPPTGSSRAVVASTSSTQAAIHYTDVTVPARRTTPATQSPPRSAPAPSTPSSSAETPSSHSSSSAETPSSHSSSANSRQPPCYPGQLGCQ